LNKEWLVLSDYSYDVATAVLGLEGCNDDKKIIKDFKVAVDMYFDRFRPRDQVAFKNFISRYKLIAKSALRNPEKYPKTKKLVQTNLEAVMKKFENEQY
jgi:predicted component of viral defense system (DUF524 family)